MSHPRAEPGSLTPLIDTLPGETAPYLVAAGEGHRYELNGQLITTIARPADTGNSFSAAYVSGDRGATFPATSHPLERRTVIVFDGLLQIWLDGTPSVLGVGDEVVIPAGTAFGYRMLSHYTRFLLWSTTGTSLHLFERLGSRVDSHVHPARLGQTVSDAGIRDTAGELGITITPLTAALPEFAHHSRRPSTIEPYVLSAGEGDRLLGFNEMHTYTSRGANTAGDYFTVHSSGAKQGYIPLHYHNQHTESFFCFEGRIWLHINGQELLLTKGDFVHAPAGTIHSYAFASHHTQMLGFLSPDIFEPFFDYMFKPTTDTVYTETTEPYFNGAGFGRVQAELDIVVVGAPPLRSKALDL